MGPPEPPTGAQPCWHLHFGCPASSIPHCGPIWDSSSKPAREPVQSTPWILTGTGPAPEPTASWTPPWAGRRAGCSVVRGPARKPFPVAGSAAPIAPATCPLITFQQSQTKGIKQPTFILPQFWGGKAKVKVLAGWFLVEASLQRVGPTSNPWLVDTSL